MTQKEFIIAYALASVSGAALSRSQLKPNEVVADALDLWNEIEDTSKSEHEDVIAAREKRTPRPTTPPRRKSVLLDPAASE